MINPRYHVDSFKDAFNGLKHAFIGHPNFRIHFLLSVLSLLAAWYFNLSKIEVIILILTVLTGFTVEFLNTAIESVCDLVTTEWRKDIKIAKDVAAAMMLVYAIGSLLIAFLLFFPHLY